MRLADRLHFRPLPKGMYAKLIWSFILMSFVPLAVLLLIAGWFAFPYTRDVFPALTTFFIDPQTDPSGATWWLVAVMALTVVIAVLGSSYLTIKIVHPVLDLSREAKRLAEDPTASREVPSQPDELGEVTRALNQLTSRLRNNMTELKQVGERTAQLNLELQQRMLVLSSLLQIGELISSGTPVEMVLGLIVERLANATERAFSFLSLRASELPTLTSRRAHHLEVHQLPADLPLESAPILIDHAHPPSKAWRPAWEAMGRPNLIAHPVQLGNRSIGVLAFGDHVTEQTYTEEFTGLVAAYATQTSIALENELLLRKNKALAIYDEPTGLYNERHLRQRLDEELKRAIAYQRPCAIAVFAIDGFDRLRTERGNSEAERILKQVGQVITSQVTEIDRVGRLNSHELMVLLPERNKRQALEIAEAIRRRVAEVFAPSSHPLERITVSGRVAENPLDGVTAEELLAKSR